MPPRRQHRLKLIKGGKPAATDSTLQPNLIVPEKIEEDDSQLQHYEKIARVALRNTPDEIKEA